MAQLFDEFKFKSGKSAKNRVVLAPMTNLQSPTTQLSDEEYKWLLLRIRGGFGVVTTCATHVMKTAQAWPGELGIYSDQHIAGFRRLAEVGHKENCLIIPQLFHGGFRCPSNLTGVQPVSASEFVIEMPNFEKPRALELNEIAEIENAFAQAARRAITAGTVGVEIHGANGYLFSQFLSPLTNFRADKYGGTLENRARILIETITQVRAAIGDKNILGVRISPEDTNLLTLDFDEMLAFATQLSQLKLDYISLSLREARKSPIKYPNSRETVLARFRKVVPSEIALTVSGQIWSEADATAALNEGADFVALGASAIANPSWPNNLRQAQEHQVAFEPRRFPLTVEELGECGVSEPLLKYLSSRWNFVK